MSNASDSLATQIKKSPLDRQAAAAIRGRILSGEFRPGHRLVETWLAEQLGLSRGTVRAALSELAHEGLVDQVAYTRWVVPPLSAQDAWELYTLRSAMEGLAARLVAGTMSADVKAQLNRALLAMSKAVDRKDRAALTDCDAALHKLIIELSNHQRLQRQYTVLEQQTRRYIACSNAFTVDLDEIFSQHQPIVKALLSGDPDAAEREARRHNFEEGALLVDQLRAAEGNRSSSPPPVRWPLVEP